jgi:hypothetical protein
MAGCGRSSFYYSVLVYWRLRIFGKGDGMVSCCGIQRVFISIALMSEISASISKGGTSPLTSSFSYALLYANEAFLRPI